MRLTTKGRYAVTAMLDLAAHRYAGPVSLAEISDRQGISLPYLEQLFAKLRRQRLVASVRGPGGGYRLGRGPERISVAEVVDSVDETVDATRCAGKADCQGGETCLSHQLWADLSAQIHGFLSGIDLASLIARQEIRQITARQDASCRLVARSMPATAEATATAAEAATVAAQAAAGAAAGVAAAAAQAAAGAAAAAAETEAAGAAAAETAAAAQAAGAAAETETAGAEA